MCEANARSEPGLAIAGATLSRDRVLPTGCELGGGLNLRRATQIGLGLTVLVMAAISLVASTTYVPDPGTNGGDVGGFVTGVIPGSPVWRDQIRPGSQVVELNASDAPGGWEIVARSSDGVLRRSNTADHIALLRSHIPWSVIAILIAAFAALAAYHGHESSAVVLPVALYLAAQPLFFAGSVVAELLAGVVLFVGAAAAVVAFARPKRAFTVPLAAGVSLAALWIISIVALADAFDIVDAARAPSAAGLSLVGFVAVADRRRIVEFLTGHSGPAFIDLIYLGIGLALLSLGLLGILPIVPAVIVTTVVIVAYPVWRRTTVQAIERLVMSQTRREASVRAVEDERSRLAREIHDAPLQELSGVIRRLEIVPGAERETDALRVVAEHLRDVATALHPPVLLDLGLAAAIEDLRDQLLVGAPEWRISVSVDDLTENSRPPAEVELAAFRVTQEAIANAMAHSGGTEVAIQGSVAAEAIELEIRDNGSGIRDERARAAKRAGHFGLESMRERAASVGGITSWASTAEGVWVTFHWEAKA